MTDTAPICAWPNPLHTTVRFPLSHNNVAPDATVALLLYNARFISLLCITVILFVESRLFVVLVEWLIVKGTFAVIPLELSERRIE